MRLNDNGKSRGQWAKGLRPHPEQRRVLLRGDPHRHRLHVTEVVRLIVFEEARKAELALKWHVLREVRDNSVVNAPLVETAYLGSHKDGPVNNLQVVAHLVGEECDPLVGEDVVDVDEELQDGRLEVVAVDAGVPENRQDLLDHDGLRGRVVRNERRVGVPAGRALDRIRCDLVLLVSGKAFEVVREFVANGEVVNDLTVGNDAHLEEKALCKR